MKLLHYFFPVNLTKSEVTLAGIRAMNQETVCLNILKQSGKPLTTRDVFKEYLRITKTDVPESSIVRAVSNLKKRKKIKPAEDKDGNELFKDGKYDHPAHLWTLN